MTPDELLEPIPSPADDHLRHRVRERTVATIRSMNRWHRMRRAASFAACFAAGAVTVWLLRPDPDVVTVEVVRVERIPAEPELSPSAPASGREMELLAEQADRDEAWRRFREAGDRYFTEQNFPAALRCYRNHLDLAPPAELATTPDSDSWLLTSLKTSRLKEIDRANFDG